MENSKKSNGGDGISTAATGDGSIKLVKEALSEKNQIGFSGSRFRRSLGGPLGTVLNFLFGSDPDIFDSTGRVRHKFSEAKWKEWDQRIRDNSKYNWKQHSGKNRG